MATLTPRMRLMHRMHFVRQYAEQEARKAFFEPPFEQAFPASTRTETPTDADLYAASYKGQATENPLFQHTVPA